MSGLERVGGWLMPEESAFSIDWKMAVLGALIIIGLVVTVTVAAMEGLPWVTKNDASARELLYDTKLNALQNTQTTTASQLAATGAQLSTLAVQVATLAQKQSDDHDQLQEMKTRKQVNSLKRELRQKQYAERLNRQHYEKELQTMERSRSVGL